MRYDEFNMLLSQKLEAELGKLNKRLERMPLKPATYCRQARGRLEIQTLGYRVRIDSLTSTKAPTYPTNGSWDYLIYC